MFAVIKTGGKQYTIKEGDIFNIEKVDVEVGANHKIEEVLFISGDHKQTAKVLLWKLKCLSTVKLTAFIFLKRKEEKTIVNAKVTDKCLLK